MQKQGIITRWDSTRAFGFIRSPGSTADVFFHLKDFRSAEPPREGMAVVYEDVHVGGKGPRAVAVQPAGAAATTVPKPRASGGDQRRHATANKASAPSSPPNAPQSGTRQTGRPRAGGGKPAAGAGLAYTLMVVWAGMLGWGVWTQRLPLWVLGALLALNVLTLWVYAADKNAARSGGWRTPENNLHTLGLLGCWAAGPQPGWRNKACATSPARQSSAPCTGSPSCCTVRLWGHGSVAGWVRGWAKPPARLACTGQASLFSILIAASAYLISPRAKYSQYLPACRVEDAE